VELIFEVPLDIAQSWDVLALLLNETGALGEEAVSPNDVITHIFRGRKSGVGGD
jgi:hypothetical protein